ncbi:hypothetical protein ASPWEDRAFT_172953 [Aspergillus wentii DTO 134E9]|uniref:Uncharacterized protein n=1 Tax=Aspergillus wentii DTO 134E9 TaxID=1073089 RepID=A0A1L9RMV7_ASPWE|nr:uncharacterized protein ASPWEDRAFT_172953 [Aspergillus wentii DTO 134E9]OJJ36167.1 hypothetical protein ASPWEDRAFT_172953 [Aspergillus wentii DTO 134E9]
MPADTLPEPVQPGDLILVHGGGDPHMLVVDSARDTTNANPKTSSVTVHEVHWHSPDQQGFWTLSGPDVYYVGEGRKEDKEDARWCLHSKHVDDEPVTDLCYFMNPDPSTGNKDVSVIVRPHGRDVLQHYWGGRCPHCGNMGWFCPGCGGATRWPDIFGSCGLDQSCPICLGYGFALDDKATLWQLDDFTSPLYRERYGHSKKPMESDELERLKNEALTMVTERYERINARRREMGMDEEDLDKLINDWKESYF